MHCHSVAVPGGRVNFYEAGAGPPVVLLHGLLGSPAYLAGLARSLARSGRRVLIPVLPGHAGSPPLEPFTFERAADRLAAAMSEAGAECPALMGHSLVSEYVDTAQAYDWDRSVLREVARTSIAASFASEDTQRRLLTALDAQPA